MSSTNAIDRINYINILLMLFSCVLAYLFPFSLLFFSYAFLGPAHYLTQISWLHDRRYFSTKKYAFIPLTLCTAALIWLPPETHFFIWIMIIFLALILAFSFTTLQYAALLVAGGVAMLALNTDAIAIFVMSMLPTVVHVFVFTMLFILVGSQKENSKSGYLSLIVMIACAASFFLMPESVYTHSSVPDHVGKDFFMGLSNYLNTLLQSTGTIENTTRSFAFLSFAYTYHYLNWFSKTRVINWHSMSRNRLYCIVAMYVGAIATYLYDYTTGFYLMLFLSVLHVVLELPLNWRTLHMIGSHMTRPKTT